MLDRNDEQGKITVRVEKVRRKEKPDIFSGEGYKYCFGCGAGALAVTKLRIMAGYVTEEVLLNKRVKEWKQVSRKMGTVEYILDVSEKLGYSKENLLRDAINMFLAANKELREKIAMELYKEDKISLGKASEIAGLSYEEMKEFLIRNNITIRRGPGSVKEMREKAERLSMF
jgi:predicted HTH domain antitoxin